MVSQARVLQPLPHTTPSRNGPLMCRVVLSEDLAKPTNEETEVPFTGAKVLLDGKLLTVVIDVGGLPYPLSPTFSPYENLHVLDSWQKLQYADDRQFEGALSILHLYRAGREDLLPLLGSIGSEIADVARAPAGATEPVRAIQQQKAFLVLANLALAGVSVKGVQVNFEQ